MTESFDPYYRWLGIATKERPPNHYRLLGLELFESDVQVIDSIASRHIEYLQEINDGPHIKQSQQLLNELATAHRCLLDPASKEAYDAELRAKLQSQRKPPKAAPPPQPPPPAGTTVVPPPAVEPQSRVQQRAAPQHRVRHKRRPPAAAPARSSATRTSGTKHALPRRPLAILVIGSTVCALALVAIGVWLATSNDRGDKTVAATSGSTARPAASASAGRSRVSTVSPQQRAGEPESGFGNQRPVELRTPSGESGTNVGESAAQHLDAAVDLNDAELAVGSEWDASISTDGLQLWLDASNVSTLKLAGGQEIRCWTDRSNNSRQAVADRAESSPELVPKVLGDRPVVRFSGAQWLEISGTSGLFQNRTDYTFVFVARGGQGTLLSKGTGETDSSFAMSRGVASFRAGDRELDAGTTDVAAFRVRSVVADAASLRWYIDGAACARHNLPHAIGRTNILRIGCSYRNRRGAEAFFQGDLAELVVYDRALTDEERSAVEDYLSGKWLSGEAAPFPFDLPEPSLAEAGDDMAGSDEAEHERSEGASEDSGSAASKELSGSDSTQHEQRFVPLKPVAMTTSAGSGLQLREDGAILSDGASEGDETFRIKLETGIPKITAILLEALPDDSLPGKGPGHGLGGAFSLSEFSVTAGPRDESRPAQDVSFSHAISDDASGAERLIDGDAKTSWTVRRRGQITRVLFLPREPLSDERGATIEVALANRDALGCFRISATSAPDPRKVPLGDEVHREGDDTLRVNLGGKAWRDPDGNQWVESKEFDGTTFGHEAGQSITTDVVKHAVFGTAQRGISAFRAVVPNGSYEVQLYFSEHWTNEPGRRIFSAFIEGQPVLQPVNTFRAPGFGRPYVHKITNVNVADGRLDIDFVKAGEDTSTILNGVSIRRAL